MNRNITNFIRYILDNFLPPIIRDNKFFMFPMFYIWFKGKNVSKLMEFKTYFHKLSKAEYSKLYNSLSIMSNDRGTDLNKESLATIIDDLKDSKDDTVIDVGCGRGMLLKFLQKNGFKNLHGCDILDQVDLGNIPYTQTSIESLSFSDKQFDVVICSHTLEHLPDLEIVINELKRIVRKKLIIVVPCQRYYHYTFDLHIHFFPEKSYLENAVNMENFICKKIKNDLLFIGSANE